MPARLYTSVWSITFAQLADVARPRVGVQRGHPSAPMPVTAGARLFVREARMKCRASGRQILGRSRSGSR